MPSPYGVKIEESCVDCSQHTERFFCDLPQEVLRKFGDITSANVFPEGAILFVEGQRPRGIYMLCSGRVKLTTSSSEGKSLIAHVAEPGEVLGLSATVSNMPYEVTAETLEPSQVNFVKKEQFLLFLRGHSDACFRVAEHLSKNYHAAYVQIRSLGLSNSAAEKLARLLLEWCAASGKETAQGIRLKLSLTQDEIAEMIGTSRETVSRLFGEFKSKQIIYLKGSSLVIRNQAALQAMVKY